jgi:hypothetical protein
MTLSNAEQYLLELMNRARLNPAAEAARFGIDLNDGLAPGTISTAAKQVLAPNLKLEAAAIDHSLYLLDQDIFSHTGVGGTDPGQRMAAEGYKAQSWGENLAFRGSTGAMTVEGIVDILNEDLFRSFSHRKDLMQGVFREVGVAAEAGVFSQGGNNFNAVMLTEDFGAIDSARFVTGVCYADTDSNRFYSMGEGIGGVVFSVGTARVLTEAAGGYAVATGRGTATLVSGTSSGLSFQASVDMSLGNVKLDLVNDAKFLSSGNITLISGIRHVELLGVANLNATGNATGNQLTGNSGRNLLSGRDGSDALSGGGGNDGLKGGSGRDTLTGGTGNDTLTGESGNDTLNGGLGADTFVFAGGFGVDKINDFRIAQNDHLSFDHSLWTGTKTASQVVSQFAHVGAGEVVFDFGAGREVHLAGLTSLAGLDGTLLIV